MIALPHHLPFVRLGDNSLTLIQSDWLEDILVDASRGTTTPDFFAKIVARGIQSYLENSYHGTVIGSDELLEKIQRLLYSMGLEEIAERLEWSPPPLRISLMDLARRAGNSEWGFMPLLEDKCQEAVNSGAAFVEYHHLDDCVNSIHGASRGKVSREEIQSQIETKIDEYRQMGELSKPFYNVTIA